MKVFGGAAGSTVLVGSGLRLPPRAEKGKGVFSGVDAEQELSDPREGLSRKYRDAVPIPIPTRLASHRRAEKGEGNFEWLAMKWDEFKSFA